MKDRKVNQMMVAPIHSIEETLNKVFNVLGESLEVAVIPKGPLILPVIKKHN